MSSEKHKLAQRNVHIVRERPFSVGEKYLNLFATTAVEM
jgi:hypothetical protein